MYPRLIRRDIQGLRALAVLAVMIFHLNPAWLPGGFVGVDIFFVISGFLLTEILLVKKQEGGVTFRIVAGFYTARARRIAPAYYAMLLLVALAAAIFFIPSDFATFRDSFSSAGLFRSNQFFANYGDYFATQSHEQPLLHTWSLAVELQFYLLVPFLILIPSGRWLPLVLVAFLIFFTLVAQYRLEFSGQEGAVYYSLSARIPEFIAGSLAAVYLASNHIGRGISRGLSIAGVRCCVDFAGQTKTGRYSCECSLSVGWRSFLFFVPLALAYISLPALR